MKPDTPGRWDVEGRDSVGVARWKVVARNGNRSKVVAYFMREADAVYVVNHHNADIR